MSMEKFNNQTFLLDLTFNRKKNELEVFIENPVLRKETLSFFIDNNIKRLNISYNISIEYIDICFSERNNIDKSYDIKEGFFWPQLYHHYAPIEISNDESILINVNLFKNSTMDLLLQEEDNSLDKKIIFKGIPFLIENGGFLSTDYNFEHNYSVDIIKIETLLRNIKEQTVPICHYNNLSKDQKKVLNTPIEQFLNYNHVSFSNLRRKSLLEVCKENQLYLVGDLINFSEYLLLKQKSFKHSSLEKIKNVLKNKYLFKSRKVSGFYSGEDFSELKNYQIGRKKHFYLKDEIRNMIINILGSKSILEKYIFNSVSTYENVQPEFSKQASEKKIKFISEKIKNSGYKTPILDELTDKLLNGFVIKRHDNQIGLEGGTIRKILYLFKDIKLESIRYIGICTEETWKKLESEFSNLKKRIDASLKDKSYFILDEKDKELISEFKVYFDKKIKYQIYYNDEIGKDIIVDEFNFLERNNRTRKIYNILGKLLYINNNKLNIEIFLSTLEKSNLSSHNKIYIDYLNKTNLFSVEDNLISLNPEYEYITESILSDKDNLLAELIDNNLSKKKEQLYLYAKEEYKDWSQAAFNKYIKESPIFIEEDGFIALNKLDYTEYENEGIKSCLI